MEIGDRVRVISNNCDGVNLYGQLGTIVDITRVGIIARMDNHNRLLSDVFGRTKPGHGWVFNPRALDYHGPSRREIELEKIVKEIYDKVLSD